MGGLDEPIDQVIAVEEEHVNDSIKRLLDLGLLSRWWCPKCHDHVLYRTLDMTERKSRRLHAQRHG